MWNAILQKAKGTISTGIEFIEDKIDDVSNEIEYGVNQLKQGDFRPAAKAIQKATSPAFAPLIDATYKVADSEDSILQVTGDSLERLTGIPSEVTQVAAGVLIPGPGEYKAAAKSVTKGVKKAFPLDGIKSIDRGGPPGPALATAGADLPQLKPDFNGAYVNLTPQVMEARAKPGMTQAQWDTQRGAEIRIKRDKVENAEIAMENITANNPGRPKKELKAKNIDGFKSELRKKDDGMAEVSSAESNIVVPTADNKYAFPRGEAGAKVYKKDVSIANEKLGRSMLGTEKQLDLHHLIPKGMSAAIYNKARDFIEKGLVDANYLNRLAEKFKKITGADTGDLQSGILPMRKPYHDAMHDEMRLQPSDTFPGERMEIMKETLTTKLNNVTKLKDFEILVDNLIKNDIKPLVDNARNWENMDDVIKSISPTYTGRAKPNVSLQKKKKK